MRFFFTLAGGFHSTPFNSSGVVQSAWVSNLQQFFTDLKNAGIKTVTPTPVTVDYWADQYGVSKSNYATCGTNKTLLFYPWQPFGLVYNTQVGTYWPDQTGGNNAYYCAAQNPNFWGWTPYFNMVNSVLGAAQSAGLAVKDLDLVNEADFGNFTVVARFIYHYATSTDVLGAIRQAMANHGFATAAVTFSGYGIFPYTASYDCGSFYGDSARLLSLSELTAVIGGAYFGLAPYNTSLYATYHLECYSSSSTSGMITIARSYSQPTVTDIHTSYQASTTSATQTSEQVLYSDMWTFLQYRSLTANFVDFGETNPVDPAQCNTWPAAQASAMLTGYLQSTLYTNHGSNVALRPWHDVFHDTCALSPNIVSPPY